MFTTIYKCLIAKTNEREYDFIHMFLSYFQMQLTILSTYIKWVVQRPKEWEHHRYRNPRRIFIVILMKEIVTCRWTKRIKLIKRIGSVSCSKCYEYKYAYRIKRHDCLIYFFWETNPDTKSFICVLCINMYIYIDT